MNKIPDFIARPSDIKNYFGSNANLEAYVKKISKGIAQTSQNFYEHLNDAREEASVPPMLFVFMIDITKKYSEDQKPHIFPVDIPQFLLQKTDSAEKGLSLYIAGSLSELYIAFNMGATKRMNGDNKDEVNSLKETNKLMGVIFHAEAYMVRAKRDADPDEYENIAPSEHPDRQECYIHSISTLIGEGVITYDIDRDKDNAKSISFDNPIVGLSFSEDETHRFEEASGRFSNLFPKALEFITEVDEEFSVTDIINQDGLSNFASVHSSVYKPY